MRIDCPSCAAIYDVPDAKLAGRKTVRCVRCGHQWVPGPVPAPADPPGAALAPDAPRPAPDLPDPEQAGREQAGRNPAQPAGDASRSRLASPATPPPGRVGLRLAWAASGLVLAMALAAAFVWRAEVVRAWPPSLRVYAALGLAHKAR